MRGVGASRLTQAVRWASSRALASRLTSEKRSLELAAARAALGLLLQPRVTRFAGAALESLQLGSSWRQRHQFAWSWWVERATHSLHVYHPERLTAAWCAAHVSGTPQLPPGGAVLLSVHQFNQVLAFVRLSELVEQLGIVSFVGLADALASPSHHTSPFFDTRSSQGELVNLYARVFGDRVYQPPNAARPSLRLLERGGYLIVKPDGNWRDRGGQILGRQHASAPGATWLARRAAKPIVPFAIVPDGNGWRLWCGEPVTPENDALDGLLEDCIRRAPTAWMLWPAWFHAAPVACASVA